MLGGNLRPRTRPSSLDRSMSARSRLPTKDEELGKRDDDFRPRRSSTAVSMSALPWRRRRVVIVVTIIVLLFYIFLPNVQNELGAINERIRTAVNEDPAAAIAYQPPAGAPPRERSAENDLTSKHYYDGVVRFYRLAQSLNKIGRTGGNMPQNRNVLFAASSLKSAANLIPMACEMARIDRNYAHVAIFGRSSLSLEDILALNGVSNVDCKVFFHDARGDYAEYSSDARAEAATRGAMKHISDFMHPQSIIMDDSVKEDMFFTRAMRTKAKEMMVSLIEIPAGKYEEWLWITRLDANSLHDWFNPEIEILINVPPGTSGSLIRLLKSLSNADYKGLKTPKLTIELPTDIEQPLKNYLWWFSWPPSKDSTQPNLLTVRHRIPSARATSEQASIRFVESFYATHTNDQHVLVFSPQAEVSPLYLQYLYYNILEYRHTSFGAVGADDVLGISLDIPTTGITGTDAFEQPDVSKMSVRPDNFSDDESAAEDAPSPFLYQGASSTATLIFGNKWSIFHDYLSKRLQASHSGKSGKTEKVVSETEPAWVEFLVELMRARGWRILHPATSFVTIHNELAQIPEEYARPPPKDAKATEAFKQADIPEEEPFVLSAEPPSPAEHFEADPTRGQMALHKMLPFNGELQQITNLPHISHKGDVVAPFSLDEKRDQFVSWFRAAIGGCQGAHASRPRLIHGSTTDDLFCLPGIPMRFADEQRELPEDDWAVGVAQAIAESTADDAEDVAAGVPTSAALPAKQPAVVETLADTTAVGKLDVS